MGSVTVGLGLGLILLLGHAPFGLACGPVLASADEPLIRLFRAYRTFGANGEWESEIRRQLGCDPCRKTEKVGSQGDLATYLFNPETPLTLTRDDLVSALVGEADRGGRIVYPVLLNLSHSGRERLRAYIGTHKDAMAVSMLSDQILDVTPLFLAHDQFGLAKFSTQQEAEDVVKRLRVPLDVQGPGSSYAHGRRRLVKNFGQ